MKYIKIYEGLNLQGFYHIPYSNKEMNIRKIFEFKAFDVVNNPENDEFLKKVKEQNPDFYGKFVSIIGNKGLESAKDKYKEYDPEWLKNRYRVVKREKKKEDKEQKKAEALVFQAPKIKIINSLLDKSYLKSLENQMIKDPIIGPYLKSYGAKKQYKNEFLKLLKKPLRLGGELRRTFNLDSLKFVINLRNDYDDFDDYFQKRNFINMIQIHQNLVFEPDPNFEILGTKLSYTIKFYMPVEQSKIDREKDEEFINQRKEYCESLSIIRSIDQKDLYDIIFNKFKQTLTDEYYEEWQMKNDANKYNI